MRMVLPFLAIALLAPLALVAQPAPRAGPLDTPQTVPDIETSIDMVPVTVIITDKDHRPLPDIQADEVTLRDNGHERKIDYFFRDVDTPLTIGLVVDVTGSQVAFLERHHQELVDFLGNVMEARDRAFLITVWGEVSLVTDLTGSLDDLRQGVESLRLDRTTGVLFGGDPCGVDRSEAHRRAGTCGGSPIWNGVYAAARLRMKDLPGRKALILLSDGFNTGGKRTLEEIIEAAQSADAPVYSVYSADEKRYSGIPRALQQRGIAEGNGLHLPGIESFRRPPAEIGLPALTRLSVETGGGVFQATDDNGAATFKAIEEELRNQYVLGFVVPDKDRDGKFHKIEVKSSRKGTRVHARKGYTSAR